MPAPHLLGCHLVVVVFVRLTSALLRLFPRYDFQREACLTLAHEKGDPQRLKPAFWALFAARLKAVPFPKNGP
jgi:hypothetical protein